MTTSASLPLVQQFLAWILQGMGRMKTVSTSRSTIKNALRGDVISQSWDTLVYDVLDVLHLKVDDQRVQLLLNQLRQLDSRTTQLHDAGLPLEDRIPSILRLLIPHIGTRLGALAALIDGGLWSDQKKVVPQMADWVTEPLSPRVFGRILEFLLRVHHAEWTTWEQRYDGLSRPTKTRKTTVVSKKTMEQWRSAQIRLPSVSNVDALTAVMGSAEDQRRARLLLSLGRVLTVAQQVMADWVGAVQVEDLSVAITAWAQHARTGLQDPESLAGLAEEWAQTIENSGSERIARSFLDPSLLEQVDADERPLNPTKVAKRLRETAAEARKSRDISELALFQVRVLLDNDPFVIGGIGGQLGVSQLTARLLADPYVLIQQEWMALALIRAVANGALPRSEAASKAGTEHKQPSKALQQCAQELLEDARRLVRSPDEPEPSPTAHATFTLRMFQEMGEHQAETIDLVNRGLIMQVLPTSLEAALDDDVVRNHPYLAIHRAIRLMREEQSDAALQWFILWRQSDPHKLWPERLAAATMLVEWAHRQLDDLAPFRDLLFEAYMDLGVEGLTESENSQHIRDGVERLQKAAVPIQALFDTADRIIRAHPKSLENVERTVLMLPLAMRLDGLVYDVSEDEDLGNPLTDATSRDLEALLREQPKHAGLWAVRVALQAFQGEDHQLNRRHAKQYGGEVLLDAVLKQLETDGLF